MSLGSDLEKLHALVDSAFAGSDPTTLKLRTALKQLETAVRVSEEYAPLVIDWIGLLISDPSLILDGDAPKAATLLGATLQSALRSLAAARDALIELRYEYTPDAQGARAHAARIADRKTAQPSPPARDTGTDMDGG